MDRHRPIGVFVRCPRELDPLGIVLVPDEVLQIEMLKTGGGEITRPGHRQEEDPHEATQLRHLIVGGDDTGLRQCPVTFCKPRQVFDLGEHLKRRIEDMAGDVSDLFGGIVAAPADHLSWPDRGAGIAHVHDLHADCPVEQCRDPSKCAIVAVG